jgi:hypothetical protein
MARKQVKSDQCYCVIIGIIALLALIGLYLWLQPIIQSDIDRQDCLDSWKNYITTQLKCKELNSHRATISDYACQTDEGVVLFFNYPDSVINICL